MGTSPRLERLNSRGRSRSRLGERGKFSSSRHSVRRWAPRLLLAATVATVNSVFGSFLISPREFDEGEAVRIWMPDTVFTHAFENPFILSPSERPRDHVMRARLVDSAVLAPTVPTHMRHDLLTARKENLFQCHYTFLKMETDIGEWLLRYSHLPMSLSVPDDIASTALRTPAHLLSFPL